MDTPRRVGPYRLIARLDPAAPGMLFAAHDNWPKRPDPGTGEDLWRMGSGNGPLRTQGSGARTVDTDELSPRVSGLGPATGYPRTGYRKGEGSRWGLAVGGNRVFFHDSRSLTALPVF
ncbi:hypothetical protein ACWDZ4_18185 [Streptomyces sp. NPDC003016]